MQHDTKNNLSPRN